ncbi:shikimate kinase [bacterium]|nr:shikimate kinase [bacterium]
MNTNIILTGLMGCGKSSVGKLLAKQLSGYIFIDIDDVIVDLEGMSIPDIFAKKSENYFREQEKELIKQFSEEEGLVIALGGGSFENEESRNILLETGKVIYLKANADTLYERIKGDKNRPLLQCENPKNKLEELLEKREKNYNKANFIIETDNKNFDTIIEEIIENL